MREGQRLQQRIALFDRLAEFREGQSGARDYYAEQVRRLVSSLVRPGSTVLEVGCGFGDLVASLDASRRVGLDVSPRMIDKARERHPDLELFVADVEHDELPAGPFDVIILSDVIGFLYDIQLAFERLAPLLSPTGRIVVTYYNFVWEPILRTAGKLGLRMPVGDQNWLSMKDIETILELGDYEVVRRGTDVLMPVAVPLVSRFCESSRRKGARAPGERPRAVLRGASRAGPAAQGASDRQRDLSLPQREGKHSRRGCAHTAHGSGDGAHLRRRQFRRWNGRRNRNGDEGAAHHRCRSRALARAPG